MSTILEPSDNIFRTYRKKPTSSILRVMVEWKSQDRRTVLNAFQPNLDIRVPAYFAGRRSEVLRLTDSLLNEGSCPVILGQRGLGKTSLAWQMIRIAAGDTELLEELGESARCVPPDDAFNVLYIPCTDVTDNKDAMLLRLMRESELINQTHLEERERVNSIGFDFKGIKGESKRVYKSVSSQEVSATVEDQFLSFANRYFDSTGRRLLCVIDEFDRISDQRGIASFIKSFSDHMLKFMLVGIAADVSALLEDHESVERILEPVYVSRMESFEANAIVAKVFDRLKDIGVDFEISTRARDRLTKVSSGLPWIVHNIGRESMRIALDSGRRVVEEWDVESAVNQVAKFNLSPQFESQYDELVGRSRKRELILKLLANYRTERIHLEDVYKHTRALQISNPYKVIDQLVNGASTFDPVLSRSGRRAGAFVSFRNAVFRHYIDIREPVFPQSRELKVYWKRLYDPERV